MKAYDGNPYYECAECGVIISAKWVPVGAEARGRQVLEHPTRGDAAIPLCSSDGKLFDRPTFELVEAQNEVLDKTEGLA